MPPGEGLAGAPDCPEPGLPPPVGLAGAPICPDPDELPPPVVKPRNPWAAALDAKVATNTRTVTAAAKFITPPNYKFIIGTPSGPSQHARSWRDASNSRSSSIRQAKNSASTTTRAIRSDCESAG